MKSYHHLTGCAVAALGMTAIGVTTAIAYEAGSPGFAQQPGIILGASAGTPGPGIYMFNQLFTAQQTIAGPGAPNVGGKPTQVHLSSEATGFLFVPGWTFLGATYDAVVVQPVSMLDIGAPANQQKSGFHNTYVVPAELSWKLGDSGFFIKTGLGIYVPDGSTTGTTGLGSIGNPWWTFQPELLVSYLKDGWNLTAFLSEEFNTKNTVTDYKSGNVVHAEFTATKTIGKWTFGPVAYYVGQVSDDTSSAFYRGAINVSRYNVWAAGGLVGYNFGPATLNVWAVDEFSANASGGSPSFTSADGATIVKGYKVFANLSFRIWAPDEPVTPKKISYYK
jgi:hypothetical protein